MIRVNFTVEGPSEQGFVVAQLIPHLARYGVSAAKPRLVSHGEKKGFVRRGGMFRYEPFKKDIQRWLKQDRHADAFFTTMIDLYGLPRDFPKYDETCAIHDPYARVAALEAALQADMADDRFIAYIQLHEFEALLLSEPAAFESYYDQHAQQIQNLMRLCEQYKSPELIDDGEHTAPSKRIGNEIPE